FTDAGLGIDTASVHLLLDGVDRTAAAQVSAGALSFTAIGLAEGPHAVSVTARDLAGNQGSDAAHFTIDTVPPALATTSPPGPTVSDTLSPTVAVTFSDATSGIDPSTLHIFLDETELTTSCRLGGGMATCPSGPLGAGGFTVFAYVRDRVGNLATATSFFD